MTIPNCGALADAPPGHGLPGSYPRVLQASGHLSARHDTAGWLTLASSRTTAKNSSRSSITSHGTLAAFLGILLEGPSIKYIKSKTQSSKLSRTQSSIPVDCLLRMTAIPSTTYSGQVVCQVTKALNKTKLPTMPTAV